MSNLISKEEFLGLVRKREELATISRNAFIAKLNKRINKLVAKIDKKFQISFNKGYTEMSLENSPINWLLGYRFKSGDGGKVCTKLNEMYPELLFKYTRSDFSDYRTFAWGYKDVKAIPDGTVMYESKRE